MNRIVIAPDSFKGTLSAAEAAEAMGRAARAVFPEDRIRLCPVADGGEGTVAAFAALPGSRTAEGAVSGPFGETVRAEWALLPDGTAVVETASVAGLPMVSGREDPLRATTFGLGELIRLAAEGGAKRILVGLGGSCTNDAGAGAAAALGVAFYDENGERFVPAGGTLCRVSRIDGSGLCPALAGREIVLLCDVDAPLYGEKGAARVFAPQKGATPRQVETLERGLAHIGALYDAVCPGVSRLPGAGAAGGLGAGLVALAGARIVPGIDTVLAASGTADALREADLVLTGEGRLDGQSLAGKVIAGVARAAAGRRVVAVAGVVTASPEETEKAGLFAAFGTVEKPVPLEEARQNAAEKLENATKKALLSLKGAIVRTEEKE